MDELLDQLIKVPHVTGAVVSSEEGLVMASVGVDASQEDMQAALAADLIGIGERLLEQGQLGERADRAILTLADGQAAVERIGEHHLVIFADAQANEALLAVDARPFIDAIRDAVTLS